jgi:Winged helix-turn helix
MAEPVRARRLTGEEGRRLLQIVRRGKRGSVRVRRAMIIMASASGTLVPAIARLVAAGEDTVRDVIRLFKARGLAALDPRRGRAAVPAWPHRAGPQAPGLPALAQRQRPPPRCPGRPAPRTSPRPQRAPASPGPPRDQDRMTPASRSQAGSERAEDDVDAAGAAAAAGPEELDLPFAHWSLRELAAWLAGRARPVRAGPAGADLRWRASPSHPGWAQLSQ